MLYGRRRGHTLTPTKQALLQQKLPEMQVTLPEKGQLDIGKDKDLWLEIGFGGGEHLAWQAKSNPGVHIIGCEPFINGIASLLTHLKEDGTTNVSIHPNDVWELLNVLPEASLSRAFILHPDPWPKKRHHKRRLINKDFLSKLASLMKPGSELRIGSDDPLYTPWIESCLESHPTFQSTLSHSHDTQPEDWPTTRYQEKAIREGRVCRFFSYVRT